MLAAGGLLASSSAANPLAAEELATVCAQTEGSAHCARKVEAVQLKRLPNLAMRDGATLTVSLYPSGTATFADTEALNGGRSYSLWDFMQRAERRHPLHDRRPQRDVHAAAADKRPQGRASR